MEIVTKYLPSVLLITCAVRVTIYGASIGDSLCMIGLATLCGFHYYIDAKKEKPINEVFKLEQVKVREELEMIKAALASMKLGVGFRK